MTERTIVLDASVGVKWLKSEAGSDEARALLTDAAEGEVRIVVPAVFPHEVLDVARRRRGHRVAREFWARLHALGVLVAGADFELIQATLATAEALECTVYDAAAPALAARLGCELYSADASAHAGVPGVRLIG
ncbi:MAG: PIN domain-containing protein [Actinobacteria bacterium]|nr:PIN domain-containing protein [Actinomycetota bacterium]